MCRRHEAREETRRQDVIALTLGGALQDVGHLALELGVVVGLEREVPYALAAGASRLAELRGERRAVREHSAHALAERNDAGAGEGGEIDYHSRPRAGGERERIGEHHAPFGIGVNDLNGDAVRRAHHFLRPIGLRTDAILGDREPGIRGERGAQFAERDERCERDRAAGHVGVHVEHRAMRLEVDPAGVEQDALADQGDVGPPAAPAARRAVLQLRDAGATLRVARRDGEEGVGAQRGAGRARRASAA